MPGRLAARLGRPRSGGAWSWAPLFGVVCPQLPTDTPESKGILFAVSAFIVMALFIAPIAGAGLFFMRAGFGTLAWMIVSHAIFGVVLGNVYGRLVRAEKG